MIETELTIETELVDLHFAAGLPGFPHLHRCRLAPWGGPESPFMVMSGIDEPEVGFVVVSPWVFYGDYAFDLDEVTAERLALSSIDDAIVVCVVTLGDRAEDATVNCLGPIVINRATREACQTVLVATEYEVRAPLARAA